MSDPKSEKRIRQRLLRLARPYWLQLSGIFLLSLLGAPIVLLLAYPLKIAVDTVIGDQPLPHVLVTMLPAGFHPSRTANLSLAVGLLLGLSIVTTLQSFAVWLLQTYTGEKLVLDFRSQLFWHAQRMGLVFHDRRGTNDLAYRIQHDAPAIQYVFLQGAAPLLTASVTFTALLYVTMRLDWKMALVALGVSPLLFLLARGAGHQARRGWDGIKKLDSSAMLVLNEALASIRVVKAFGQEEFEHHRFRLRSRQRMQEQVKVASRLAAFSGLMSACIAAGTAVALWIGVRHVQAGVLTLGELLLIMAYMAQLYEPLRTISGKLPELQGWMASVERALELLEDAPEPAEATNALNISRAQGSIAFHKVSFAYSTSGPALDDISFEVPPGAQVGIIGPSGSGKSTLVNLLMRFYDPASGTVALDGRDLSDYNLVDLRRQFAIILQEPVVFSASVAENIAYARPNASREEIMAAARTARAEQFIRALPNGYDTLIGEGGCRLSGGERQRLGIARAFLKDAPVLILDEPTSAVDVATEAEIMEATRSLVRGRTTFVIAHRLSTVKNCDLILALKSGRLVAVTGDLEHAIQAVDASPALLNLAAAARANS